MRVFIAGGTGVIGSRVAALLAVQGHDVAATSRSIDRVKSLAGGQTLDHGGVVGMVVDILDSDGLAAAVRDFAPDVVMHQVTDLPRSRALLPFRLRRLARVRTRGTDNLVAAASAVDARVIAQSVAFPLPRVARRPIDHLETTVLGASGLVLRYGAFYGDGTWSPTPAGDHAVHIDAAARATVDALGERTGIIEVLDAGVTRVR